MLATESYLTDIIWHYALQKVSRNMKKIPTPIQDVTWAYYNDTDQLDFQLFNIGLARRSLGAPAKVQACLGYRNPEH